MVWGLGASIALAILVMTPVTGHAIEPGKRLALSWMMAALAGLWLVSLWHGRRTVRLRLPLVSCLGILLVVYAFATYFSPHPQNSALELRRMAALFGFAWLAGQVVSQGWQLRLLLALTVGGMALASLYGVAQYAGLEPLPWAHEEGSTLYSMLPASLGNPNAAGHAMLPSLLALGYLAGYRRWRWMLVLLPLFLFHLYHIDQRAVWLALTVAGAVFLAAWMVKRQAFSPATSVLVVCGATLCLFALGGMLAMPLVMRQTGTYLPDDNSMRTRMNAYEGASRMVLDRPVLGWGPRSYRIECVPYWTATEQLAFARQRQMNAQVHNEYLEFAVEAGFSAAFAYLLLISTGVATGLYAWFAARDPEAQRIGLFCAVFFAAFSVDSFFGFNARLPASAAILFVWSGALDGVLHSGRETKANRQSRAFAMGIALLLVSVVLACYESRAFYAEMRFRDALDALEEGDLTRADAAFADAQRNAPWDWVYPSERGVLALQQGEDDEAAQLFLESLRRNPYYLMSLLEMASTRLQTGQRALAEGQNHRVALKNARAWCMRAVELCPPLPDAWALRGRIALVAAEYMNRQGLDSKEKVEEFCRLLIEAEIHLRSAIALGSQNEETLNRVVSQIENALRQHGVPPRLLPQ